MPINDKSRFAYNHLISRGLTPIQAAGIVGNLQAESNFNTTALGDNKSSIGIAQWHNERKQGLLDFAKSRGERYDNLTTQLDYVIEELSRPEYAKAMKGLSDAKNPQEAAIAFMNHYEKPAEWAKKQSVGQRVNVANSILSGTTYEKVDYISEQSPIVDIPYLSENYDALSPQQRAEFNAFMSSHNANNTESTEDTEIAEAKNELIQKENEKNFLDELNSQYQEAQQQQTTLQQKAPVDNSVYSMPQIELPQYQAPEMPGFQTGGGFWNTYVDPVISTVTDFFTEDEEENVAKKKKPVNTNPSYFDAMQEKYDDINSKKSDTINRNDYIKNNTQRLNLTKGRYKNAKINPNIVDEAFKTAKEKNIDPFEVLAVIGRENVFGKGYSYREGRQVAKFVEYNKKALVSGWNVSEDYRPESPGKFLADRQVPGIKTTSDEHGWYFNVEDKGAVDEHLSEHPRLLEQYNKKLTQTKNIKGADSFDMAVDFIKKKGLKNYNPNDPNYQKMVMDDYHQLKSDPVLMNYINKKYNLDDYSKSFYEDGGEMFEQELRIDKQYQIGGKIEDGTIIILENGGELPIYQSAGRYIDMKKEYGIDPLSKIGIEKARKLAKENPSLRFVCDASGCSEIAVDAAEAYDQNFYRGNAWDLGNSNNVEYINPKYSREVGQNGPLSNPSSYDVNNAFINSSMNIIGLNRTNNLRSNDGKSLPNTENNRKAGMAKNRDQANDSFDYANPQLYPNTRGYEHVGFNLGNGELLHGTAANSEHPAFYTIDNMSDGISLPGYGNYDPVESISTPTLFQRAVRNVKKLSEKEMGGYYEDGGSIPERYRNMGFTRVGAKRQSTRPGKKWMVLAKKGSQYKVVHGGYDGMKDFSQHGSKDRKKRFWDRMGGRDSAKANDPFSPLYWHKRFGTWAEGGYFTEKDKKTFSELKDTYPADTLVDILTYMSNGGTYGLPMYQDAGVAQGNPVKIVTLQDADGTMRKVRTDSQEYADLYKSGNLQSGDISENSDRETWFGGELDQINLTNNTKKKTVLTPAGIVESGKFPSLQSQLAVSKDDIRNIQFKLKNEADQAVPVRETIPTFVNAKMQNQINSGYSNSKEVSPSNLTPEQILAEVKAKEQEAIKNNKYKNIKIKDERLEGLQVKDNTDTYQIKEAKQKSEIDAKDKSVNKQSDEKWNSLMELDKDIKKALEKSSVMEVQKKLYSLGYDLGSFGKNKDGIDGIMGSKTKKALELYKKNGDKIFEGDAENPLSLEQEERIARLKKPEKSTFENISDFIGGNINEYIVNPVKELVSEKLPYNLQYKPELNTTGVYDDTKNSNKYLLDNMSLQDIRKQKNVSFLQISKNKLEGNSVLPTTFKERVVNATNAQGYMPDYEIKDGEINLPFFDRLADEKSKTQVVKGLSGNKGKKREDIYRMYAGLPQKNDTFTASSFKAGADSDTNVTFKDPKDVMEYLKIAATRTDLFEKLANGQITPETIDRDNKSNKKGAEKINKAAFRDPKNVMWNATFGINFDKQGNPYLSFYDNWDLAGKDDIGKIVKDKLGPLAYTPQGATVAMAADKVGGAFGKPIEIYDRIPLSKELVQKLAKLNYKFYDKTESDAISETDEKGNEAALKKVSDFIEKDPKLKKEYEMLFNMVAQRYK